MTRRLAPVVAILATALMRADAPAAAPQVTPTGPTSAGDRVAIGSADVNRYEARYGKPEFRTLEDDSEAWPERQSIRTVGVLEPIPGRGQKGRAPNVPQKQGSGGRYDSPLARYRICGRELRKCVALVPVEEMPDVFDGPASIWMYKPIEVIGAVDEIMVDQTKYRVFLVWSVFDGTPLETRKKDGSKGSSLEPLVRYPKGAEGTEVTVSGVFRGANLFEDLPPESRRDESDWVLQDGPFSIWVTGKAPKGKGFSLDPRSRSDCRYRLEATGKVSTANGFIYLRASSLQLLGRAKM
jgi:hypothetical protein